MALILVFTHIKNAIRYYLFERPRSVALMRSARLNIMSSLETIEYIKRTGCSVARYGDGELALAFKHSIGFQEANANIQAELKEILANPPENLLVCLPECYTEKGLTQLVPNAARGWRRCALESIPMLQPLLHADRLFGDALITRPYMIYKHRKDRAGLLFESMKDIWREKDILLVEGKMSRLGVGNDLFAGAKSVRRILCPAFNAYDKVDEIERTVVENAAGSLVLLALGPTATVLAWRLARRGVQALDVGHVDVEYVWYKLGAKEKVPIPGKYVHEANSGVTGVSDCKDESYLASVIAIIG